jgi:integrase
MRDPKGGIDQTIPMSAEVREILENHARTESPFVFPGRSGQKQAKCSLIRFGMAGSQCRTTGARLNRIR